jgi:hypothetical protein
MAIVKKYIDTPRFPKVQTNGIEKEFKDNYLKLLSNLLKNLGSEMMKKIKK